MRTFFLIALSFYAACDSADAQNHADLAGYDSTSSPTGAASSDASESATIVRVHYPAGMHALSLRGSVAPLDWSTGHALSSAAGSPDTYEIHLDGVTTASGDFEVKPLLDDVTWSQGGNYHARVGAVTEIYPHFFATAGKVIALFPAFHSDKLGNTRKVWAYLPAGYDENTTASYPVLYMHDGQNLFDPAIAFNGNEWKVDETLDAAAAGSPRTIADLIVIGPENIGDVRIAEYTPTASADYPGSGKGALYLAMITEELKPAVNMQLRTKSDRGSTGIMGSSLGGLISAWAGVDDEDVFGIVGAMSPSTWWDNEVLVTHVGAMQAVPARPLRVYIDSGGPDDDGVNTGLLCDAYRKVGYVDGKDFLQVVDPTGQHNEIYWAKRLPAALQFLFPAL